MIHRYRRRWLKRNLRPCPNNCKLADMLGRRVVGCEGCGSRNPEQCLKDQKFEPLYTKEELYKQFRERIRNPEILLREYRDIAALLWAIGGFDEELDETVIAGVEQREEPKQPNSDSGPAASAGLPGASQRRPAEVDPHPTTTNPRSIKRQAVSNGNK